MTSSENPIPELDRRGLREFSLVTGGMFAAVFGVIFPWLLEFSYPVWPWVLFAVIGALGIVMPEALRPVHYWWMRFALILSKVTTPIILGSVFFLVFAPMGLVMRAFGWDAMHRKLDPRANTYRVDSDRSDKIDLEKPF